MAAEGITYCNAYMFRNLRAIPGISSSQKLIEKEREERETRKLSRAAQSKKTSYEEDDDEDSNDDEREEEPTESTVRFRLIHFVSNCYF